MTTKKKLIISISSMGLAVVAALGVTFGVLAAQQQAVRNQFSVTYEARNVNAIAKASYKLKNGADDSSVNLLDNEADSVSFTATEATTTKSLSGSTAAQLTATIDYVVYMFEFKNNTTAATGARSMTVALTDNATATNVNVYYATTTSATVIDADDFDVLFTQSETKKLGSSSEDATALTLATTVPATATTVAPQQYGYFFIVVEIIDNTIDASYVSTTADNSGIAWTLESINNA